MIEGGRSVERAFLHLTYLSMNLRWNSERIVSLMKCFSWAETKQWKIQWTFSPHIVQLKYMQSPLRLLIDSIAPGTFWAGLEMRVYLTALVHVCNELFVITSIFARWLLASILLTNSSNIYLRAKLVWSTLFLCSPFAQFLNTTSSSHLRRKRENTIIHKLCHVQISLLTSSWSWSCCSAAGWGGDCLWAGSQYGFSPPPPCALAPDRNTKEHTQFTSKNYTRCLHWLGYGTMVG